MRIVQSSFCLYRCLGRSWDKWSSLDVLWTQLVKQSIHHGRKKAILQSLQCQHFGIWSFLWFNEAAQFYHNLEIVVLLNAFLLDSAPHTQILTLSEEIANSTVYVHLFHLLSSALECLYTVGLMLGMMIHSGVSYLFWEYTCISAEQSWYFIDTARQTINTTWQKKTEHLEHLLNRATLYEVYVDVTGFPSEYLNTNDIER